MAIMDLGLKSLKKVWILLVWMIVFIPNSKKPLWNSSLRFNEDQKWYYYPDMTVNETLVFNQVVLFKDNPESVKMQVFHSAFKDPTAPRNSEIRQSREYRIPIWFEK